MPSNSNGGINGGPGAARCGTGGSTERGHVGAGSGFGGLREAEQRGAFGGGAPCDGAGRGEGGEGGVGVGVRSVGEGTRTFDKRASTDKREERGGD